MSRIELWLGPAGSGKSTAVARDIAAAMAGSPIGPKRYWLVPSDASYVAEQTLLREVPATLRAEVLTLQRLASRLNESLRLVDGDPVNVTGKRLLLADVFAASSTELRVLRRVNPTVPFLDAVLDVFAEMSRHRVSLDRLQAALEAAATELSQRPDDKHRAAGVSLLGKLRDLCVLYLRWRRTLQDHHFYDPDELPLYLAESLGKWPEGRGAAFYLDGFDDVSPRDLTLLLALSKSSERLVITATADLPWLSRVLSESASGDGRQIWWDEILSSDAPPMLRALQRVSSPHTVYAPQTLLWLEELIRFARAEGADIVVRPIEDVLSNSTDPTQDRAAAEPHSRLRGVPALQRLERGLYGEPEGATPGVDAVTVAAAQNPRVEAERVAAEISHCIAGGTQRPGDILVLVSDLTEYGAYLRDGFARHGVPAYIDDVPSLSAHPLAKCLLAALAATEEGASVEAMVRWLKSEFCGLSPEDADWLEAYIRRQEVAGLAAWTTAEPWTYQALERGAKGADEASETSPPQPTPEDRRADDLRKSVAVVIGPMLEALRVESVWPKAVASELWSLLERAGARRRLAGWMVSREGAEDPVTASRHEQAWQKILSLLDDLAAMQPSSALPKGFLLEVIRNDLTAQTLPTIPAGSDEVLVTGVDRASGAHYPMVFLLGLRDGILPRKATPIGLLQDDERMQFERLFGQRLGYTTEERQWAERLRVYTALTRGMRSLTLSTPLSTLAGKAVAPSRVLGRVQTLFPDVRASLWLEGDEGGVGAVWTPTAALDLLVLSLRKGIRGEPMPVDARFIYEWFVERDEYKVMLDGAMRGFRHHVKAPSLTPGTARTLFGVPMTVSAYQLESFAACGFQHFVKFGLRVREEQRPEVTRALRGTLLHDVLHRFVRRFTDRWTEWRTMTDEAAEAAMQQEFESVVNAPSAAIWRRRPMRRQQASETLSVLQRAAVLLTRHVRYSQFQPVALELPFGDENPGLSVTTADGVEIRVRGRIDRVDVAEDKGRRVFRVIDYKSQVGKTLPLYRVKHGLSIQLPLYAAVVASHSDSLLSGAAEPVGVLYFPVGRSLTQLKSPAGSKEALEAWHHRLRARGWLLEDADVLSWMDERIASAGESELFGKFYKRDGTPAKSAPILPKPAWRALLQRTVEHVRDHGERILQGQIDIAPYWLSETDNGCQNCELRNVCHLEPRERRRHARVLDKPSDAAVAESWGHVDGGVQS